MAKTTEELDELIPSIPLEHHILDNVEKQEVGVSLLLIRRNDHHPINPFLATAKLINIGLKNSQ